MSGAIVGWAFKQKTNSSTSKLLLACLAEHADANGVCWPSKPLLAEECELTTRTIEIQLAKLEASELIWIERKTHGNAHLGNVYHLNVRPANVAPPKNPKRSGAANAPLPNGGDGGTELDSGGGTNLDPDYIEEPSLEPSRNPHKGGGDSKSNEVRNGTTDSKAWTPKVMKAYRTIPGHDPCSSEPRAKAAYLAIPCEERPPTFELIGCLDAYRKDLERKNDGQAPERRVRVRQLETWLKDRRYEGFLPLARSNLQNGTGNSANLSTYSLPPEIVARLAKVGFETPEISAWFGDAHFIRQGDRWAVTVSTRFKAERVLKQWRTRVEQAFGENFELKFVKDSSRQ